MDKLTIEGTEVTALSPEGLTAQMALANWLARVAPPRIDTQGVVLPDGTKLVISRGPVTIVVHEASPRVHCLRWIANDSPEQFGPRTTYRQVRVALPYVVVLAVFVTDPNGVLGLSSASECFFCTAPLTNGDEELCFPALLNCSRFAEPEGHPLSWICTEKLARARVVTGKTANERIRSGLRALLHCLLETGFNYSSEHHEGSSWFTESRRVDPRIDTVENWQAATEQDPLFVLEVPWLKVGQSVTGVVERIFKNLNAAAPSLRSAGDLARLVFNNQQPELKESLVHEWFVHSS